MNRNVHRAMEDQAGRQIAIILKANKFQASSFLLNGAVRVS